jgi:hypothetical protein
MLDQFGMVPLDVARRIDHVNRTVAPKPVPSKEYGAHLAGLCQGCHGARLSGGRIPGAPPEIPVPLNLTMHETGLKEWSFDDFERLMRQGMRKNGQKLNPFMPIESMSKFDDTEMRALWAYLQSTPPVAFGNR